VEQAFRVLDKKNAGVVTPEDIMGVYDSSKHPDVLSGKRTPQEVLREFLDTFDVGGEVDGKVTKQEFINYYSNIGASIDDDNYFELMVRNAWHISGGLGAAANTANRRVLITRDDGSQAVEEIKDDLGLRADDKASVMGRLKKQGVYASNISLFDGMEADGNPKQRRPTAASAAGSLGSLVTNSKAPSVDQLEAAVAAAGPGASGSSGNSRSAASSALANVPAGVAHIVQKLKVEIRSRGGTGFISLQRKFRIIDDDNSKSLSMAEFKKAMKEMNMGLSDNELRMLFDHFDADRSGSIDFEEFIQGVRDPLTERRLRLVQMAFSKIDKDGSGEVDAEEIATMYDASKHPEVIAGRKSPKEILTQFLSTFDVGGEVDGKVTLQEFINYYTNIGANIDNEDYFELMIRNAWHISGGVGAAANSANRRVLVTRPDGSQYVEEIKDDLGLKAGDKSGIMARLKAQGVEAASISLFDGGDDGGGDSASPKPKPLEKVFNERKAAVPRGGNVESVNQLRSAEVAPEVSVARMGPRLDPNRLSASATSATSTTARLAVPPPGLQMMIKKLKAEMKARGAHGFIGLQRKFRIMDDDGSKTLDMGEFKKAMKEMNMGMSDAELRLLFDYFDTDHNGTINFDEFIQGVRDPLTERRLRLVNMAFTKIDKDGSGEVDVQEIASIYDASKHPDVLAGKKTPEQVFREFLDTFDVGGEVDGKVTLQEFTNYYNNLSASIDNEDYFELMIRNAWHISGGEGAAANSANRRVLVTRPDGSQYVEEIKDDLGLKAGDKEGMMGRLKSQGVFASSLDTNGLVKEDQKAPLRGKRFSSELGRSTVPSGVLPGSLGTGPNPIVNIKAKAAPPAAPSAGLNTIIDKLKNEIGTRGGRGFIGLQRKFRIMDDDGSKTLDMAEFKKGMKEMNMGLSDVELRMLFEHFDTDRSGTIDFEEFIQGIRDPLTERRLRLVQTAFSIIDRDGSGVVDVQEIATMYDASKHPEVIAGRMTPEQVFREFLDTFDVGGEVDGKVTQQEFINYYTNLGASIDNEEYFELMIRNAWHISGGEGAAANSSNRRVLVTRSDGSQYVEEIKNDLGLRPDDKAGMIARLKAQGVDAANISLFDDGDDSAGAGKVDIAAGGRKKNFSEVATERPSRKHVTQTASRGVEIGESSGIRSPAKLPPPPPPSASIRKGREAKQADFGLQLIIQKLKSEMKNRGGGGFIALQRKFRIMDDDNSKTLDMGEFKKAMKEMNMGLSDAELRMLFDHFDGDHSGTIDFEEFIQGVRDPLSDRRQRLVNLAFDMLDEDKSGVVEASELLDKYDASKHPDVIAGKKTAKQVLSEWMSTFDVGGEVDGCVTRQEFLNYYTNIGANIDNEDYFELMIRNAWHISGGEGAAANSANRRVLVSRQDGRQYVEEIKNDLGLKANDKMGMLGRLKAQGVDAANISLFDGGDDSSASQSVALGALAREHMASKRSTTSSLGVSASFRPSTAPTSTKSTIRPTDSMGSTLMSPDRPTTATTGNLGSRLKQPDFGLQLIIQKLKAEMKQRGGSGFIGLQRKFRIMDDDGSKSLDMGEFKKAMKEMNMGLGDAELRMLFDHFDADSSGTINFEEFIQGVRDPLTERRARLVNMAFDMLDDDRSGVIEANELLSKYDASRHPDVMAGKKTVKQVLTEWMSTFDVGGEVDGCVTRQEFLNYYTNIGANIDNEDYFELMIRNAWHLSGGEGAAANSANRRVLATRADGSQYVEEIKNDLGLKANDKSGMIARLRQQNAQVSQISLFGGGSDGIQDDFRPGSAPSLGTSAAAASKGRVGSGVRMHESSVIFGDDSRPAARPSTSAGSISAAQRSKAQSLAAKVTSTGRTLDDILADMKSHFEQRGVRGIVALQRRFKIMDDNNSGSINMSEFKKAMRECSINLSDEDCRLLFSFFDTDGSGELNFEEFVEGCKVRKRLRGIFYIVI
jgi:Ca2+-binding EF-hand superfamily protein